MNCQIVDYFFEVMNLLIEEQKRPKDYGTGMKVNHIEVSFLNVIYNCPNANVSNIAEKLGITKGAVTQTYSKLMEKDLVESFMREGNKKEKYFRLTENGKTVRDGHEKFHDECNRNLCRYFSSLNDEEVKVVFNFMEQLKECVPFSDFICQHNGADCAAKEETDEADIITNNESQCSIGDR